MTHEPAQNAERRLVHQSTNAPLPAIQMGWHIGAARDVEIAVLDLIETLLGAGRSSRLYRSLVYTHQVSTSAWAGADWTEQPGLFTIRAIASAGKKLDEVEKLIGAEIEALAAGEFDEAELTKAKTQLYAMLVRGRANYNDMAQAMMRSAIVRGSAHLLDEDLERYNAVDAAAIQAVAKHTFHPRNRTIVEYLAKP
jgi:zinc protease